MLIRIEGHDLPGRTFGPSPSYPNVHVGVQRRARPNELLGLVRGDAPSATWVIDGKAAPRDDGLDITGPFIQGPPGGRFIYLSWGAVDEAGGFTMFRRAKLWLEAVPIEVGAAAVDQGVLIGRVGLSDQKGGPLCASVRPPVIEWSAAAS
ncbi:MAG: monooxygenase [Pseudonocardiales bacterium]|nr:monooxygenase [Pseudonocardiales bacterium]